MFERYDETVIHGIGWYAPNRRTKRVLKEIGESLAFIAMIALITVAMYAWAISSVPAGK